jgi:hypothetical protein
MFPVVAIFGCRKTFWRPTRVTGLVCRCKWCSWFRSPCSGVKYSAVSGVYLQLVVCWGEQVLLQNLWCRKTLNLAVRSRRPSQVVASGIPGVQPLFRSDLALQQVLLQLVATCCLLNICFIGRFCPAKGLKKIFAGVAQGNHATFVS